MHILGVECIHLYIYLFVVVVVFTQKNTHIFISIFSSRSRDINPLSDFIYIVI